MRLSRLTAPFGATLAALVLLAVPAAAQDTNAQCTATFDAAWSAQTHPIDFPADPHFSPLVGAIHSDQVVFWEPGGFASPGIQDVAEFGSTGEFLSEIAVEVALETARSAVTGGAVPLSPGTAQASFEAAIDHSQLTLVTMIAPSPDWIVGTHGLELFQGGKWPSQLVVDLLPYDAGTDSGATFTSPNNPTFPHEPIALITQSPFPNGVPLGTYTVSCASDLVFLDDFESGEVLNWSAVVR